jgi:cytochrome c
VVSGPLDSPAACRFVFAALAAAAIGCGPVSQPGSVDRADTAPSAGAFDVGEIKPAAEYIKEPRFASADRERGELLALACAACHTFGAGERHNIGPNLHGVFGRRAATVRDFAYSPALRESGLVWTPRALEAWLAEPTRFVPGTTMAFAGYRDEADRTALIAYLLNATD